MKNPIAILFPGQGSQENNMGRDIAESSKEMMSLWEKAESISKLPLRAVYWESNDMTLMSDTQYLQPALTVVNMSIWQQLSKHLVPGCVAGHSLGEFSALAAAKVLSFESVLELVCLRGKLMSNLEPSEQGSMIAILCLNQNEVECIVKEVSHNVQQPITIANYNTPVQFVVSGTKEAIESTIPFVKEKRGRAVLLPVSGAFHSPLMEKASQKFSEKLSKMNWSTPLCPIYTNSTGSSFMDTKSIYDSILNQMISPVHWINVIINQWKDGTRKWIEVGPKGVLSRMVTPILEEHISTVDNNISVHSIDSLKTLTCFTSSDSLILT